MRGASCSTSERRERPDLYLAAALGGGHAARRRRAPAPILSVFRIAFDVRYTLPGDLFPNVDRVGGARCPVLVIHGTHDEVVPFWHGQELFLATRPEWRFKPFWITGAGHNNIELLLRDSGALFKKLGEFVDFCSARRQAS